MKIEHCGQIYRLANVDAADDLDGGALKLCSIGTIDQFPPAAGDIVTYKVANDAVFVNTLDPTDTITIKAGSTVDMNHN
jgi:hypothetical protein